MAATAPPMATLIHHGDRSRIANSESCLSFQFMTVSVAFRFARLPMHAAEHPTGEYRGAEPLPRDASTGGRNAGGPVYNKPERASPWRNDQDCTMTIERRHVGKRLSGLVIHHASGTAYLAGQVADDPKADVSGQTRQVLKLIDSLLAEAGSDKTKILSATIFLPDIADFAAMNAVWEEWVVPGHTPARATVEAKLASPEYRVEIQVVAACPVRK